MAANFPLTNKQIINRNFKRIFFAISSFAIIEKKSLLVDIYFRNRGFLFHEIRRKYVVSSVYFQMDKCGFNKQTRFSSAASI